MVKGFSWEVAGTDVLCDSSDFSGLNACFADFVEERSLATVNVTKDTYDWLTSWHFGFSRLTVFNKPSSD